MNNLNNYYLTRIINFLKKNYDISLNNKSITKNHKFTLVIPTHGRLECLQRSIKFFTDLEADIIYCDSALNKYNGQFAQNMRYIHLPGMKFESKLKNAFQQANTEFIAICAVDDFAIHDSLYRCAEFLNKNRQYATVLGRFLAFQYHFDGKFIKMNRHVKITDFNDKDLKIRVKKYFENFFPVFYAMHKKNILIEAMDICEKCNFKNIVFIEMVLSILACARGYIKVLPYLWGVREYNPANSGKRKYINRIYQDRSIKVDFFKMKEMVDKAVYDGYSAFVINCYLKFCASMGIKY
ncbi:TIGR00180 family glycosyltransferase [Halocella sp. SP3-1]|uniref:TIGR00180 family glycosyltransferase n=1 Tax=Halocella sp. SP3-1 TaxID=2382161 RepID=UPI000F760607|nr:TIGR00180 family glycosyltransferase [Halocella sp. SP3-1]AZO96311.1 TIGR00180 family glycosyltransferase [Halocella sp. SP3-1]